MPATGTRTAIAAAVACSNLCRLPSSTIDHLIEDATLLRIPAGSTLRRDGDTGPHAELVVSGLLRIFVTAPDGRTLTIRYCRPGALLGVVSLFRDVYVMPGSIGAVTDSEVLLLRPSTIKMLADADLAVARALAEELAERVFVFVNEIPGSAFATVRERIAQHLLDLASEHRSGPELLAAISQQQLADAVGTVREVVVRVLRELREEGLVETRRDGIRVLDPELLLAQTFAADAGTQVPLETSTSR